MNLLWDLKTYKMSYPLFKVAEKPGIKKPVLLAVADSYWWNIFNLSISNTVFNEGKFWFYNKGVYPDSFNGSVDAGGLDFKQEVDRADLIIICATEATMPELGWGFIDNLYDYFKTGMTKAQKEKKIHEMIEYIKSDAGWMKALEKRAQEQGLPVDSVVKLDAGWQVEQNLRSK